MISSARAGHIYSAQNDYSNALSSHQQCVALMKTQGNELQEAREIGNVGAVHLASGDFDRAVECHLEHLQIAVNAGNKVCSLVCCLFTFHLFIQRAKRAAV